MSAEVSVEALSSQPSSSQGQGSIIPLEISSLTASGDGVGHYQGRAVFIPNSAPGDQLQVRLVRVKPSHATGLIVQIDEPSPSRVDPLCIVADKCGGCQWQHVSYAVQLAAKQQTAQDALERVGGLVLPVGEPILGSSDPYAYRNKATYPIQARDKGLKAGYYRLGSHQLINLNQCPIQDSSLDLFLREIKQDLQITGWSAYDEKRHKGSLRHLGLRVGRRSGEVLLTLVSRDPHLPGIEDWADQWLSRYPTLVGVCLNINPDKTNAIFGAETQVIAGRGALQETFGGHTVWVDSTSFFQVNTEQAEAFFTWIVEQMGLTGSETVVDAYCGIGTLSLLLAARARQVIGIESLPNAVRQARHNARFNHISNFSILEGSVEQELPTLPPADGVVLDPPRKGCDPLVLDTLLLRQPRQIVYISCHPATLARDLKILTGSGLYRLTQWRSADFFPQTPHVESVAFLTLVTDPSPALESELESESDEGDAE